MNSRSKKKNLRGYLLIEVLVTVVVLGTVIIFIIQALNSSLFAVRRAHFYTKALLLAEELDWNIKLETLNGTLIPVETFPRSSDFLEAKTGFSWKEEIRETEFLNLSELIMRLSWERKKASGGFSLSTYIPTTASAEE